MIYRIISSLFVIPFILLFVLFSISNREIILLHLWPFPFEIEMPVYLTILFFSFIFFIFGGLLAWIPYIGTKKRIKHQKKKIEELENTLLKQQKQIEKKSDKSQKQIGDALSSTIEIEETE